MSLSSRKRAGYALVIGAVAVALSFFLGRWSSSLQDSLQKEAAYPWELHRKIASANIRCDTLRGTPATGQFYVESLDAGAVLIVATLDKKMALINAFALGASGQIASDSWQVDCK